LTGWIGLPRARAARLPFLRDVSGRRPAWIPHGSKHFSLSIPRLLPRLVAPAKPRLDPAPLLWRMKVDERKQQAMMNRFEGPGSREARIRYLDGDFQVVSPGAFVRCAVTGESIPLEELKYWNVARQEPYLDCEASLRRELEMNPQLRTRS